MPVGDELRYFYTFNDVAGGDYFNFAKVHPIDGWGDIFSSLYAHYMNVNGRIPVHFLEMVFSGIIGLKWFYPLNVAVFLLTVLLTVGYFKKAGYGKHTVLILSALLLLFPEPSRLWVSVNLSLNYLWPACMAIGMLCCLQTKRWKWWMAILAFFFGWSNEAFSLSFAAGLTVSWLSDSYRNGRIRLEFRSLQFKMLMALAAGCLFLILSPGNWHRASAGATHAAGYFTVLSELIILWVLLGVGIVGIIRSPRGVWHFIKNQKLLIAALVTSLLFGIVAHRSPLYDGNRAVVGIADRLRPVAENKRGQSMDNSFGSRLVGDIPNPCLCGDY